MMENDILFNQNPVSFEEREDEVGSFTLVFQFLRRFLILIIAFTLFGLGFGLGYAKKRDYTTYTQTKSVLFIAKIEGKSMATNISLTNKYLDTIIDTIKTPVFISKARELYQPNDYIYSGSIDVQEGGGMILSISYTDEDPKVAEDKLDAFIAAVGSEIADYIQADEVRVLPIDNVPSTTSSNDFAKYVLIGILGGLVLGIAVAFLFYMLDNTVSSKSELERLTGATVVAYIDDIMK